MKRQRSGDEATHLAGWLFADLFVILFVIGIASIVLLKPVSKPTTAAAKTTTTTIATTKGTTTTTTKPKPKCLSLLSLSVQKKEEGLWIEVDKKVDLEGFKFALGLKLLEVQPELATDLQNGNLRIGLILGYGGVRSDGNIDRAAGEAKTLLDRLSGEPDRIFGNPPSYPDVIYRYFGTKTVSSSKVGLEVFPWVSRNC